MSFSRRFFYPVKVFTVVAIVGVFTLNSLAQTSDQYTKATGYFPNPGGPYKARTVAQPNFNNSSRIQALIRDGKLMLSMSDAITLALENNLDLAIARYNLPIADTDILRSKSGNSIRGVNTGVVSGTPGGTGSGVTGGAGASGGGAGGTTTAAGGAGTGSAGIVASTSGVGAAIPSFDPSLTSTFQVEKNSSDISRNVNPLVSGLLASQTNTTNAGINYLQGFSTGTQLSVGFNSDRTSQSLCVSMPSLCSLNPSLASSLRATVTQPLLAGFGIANNTRNIRIAKNNREISDVAFRQQVISTVSQIQNIYWDLVAAYEDVKAKERALALAERLLGDNRKQVEIGTLAPIEVVRAESQAAASSQDLIVSQTNLQLQQLLMINAVTRNMGDLTIATVPVIPTDTMELPQTEPVTPIQDLIADALAHRPELAESQIDLTNRDITKKAARNALLPTLNLVGWYGGSGLAGNPTTNGLVSSGYSDALGDTFNGTSPDKGVGIQLNIPIRNRSAQADQVRSELEYRQAQMRLQQLQNQIRVDVRNSQFAVQQNRARVEAAIKGRELAQQSLDAEQKKYALGASTTYNVLQMQRDLATAESSLVASKTAYEKSKVALDQSTGLTISHLGIEITDAESANVTRMPLVPNVTPRQDVTPTQQQTIPQAEIKVATPTT